jgi:hypothetical protein
MWAVRESRSWTSWTRVWGDDKREDSRYKFKSTALTLLEASQNLCNWAKMYSEPGPPEELTCAGLFTAAAAYTYARDAHEKTDVSTKQAGECPAWL